MGTNVLILATVVFIFACATKESTGSSQNRFPSQETKAQNAGVGIIDDPSIYSRVVVVSDVHGMFKPLMTLLQAGKIVDAAGNWSGGATALFVLGDSIDKGPQTVEVLNLWIRLQSQAAASGGILIHTLGNHEAEFLADPQNPKASELIGELKTLGLPVSDLTTDAKPLGQFILAEPVALKAGNWLFCHAGFYPDLPWLMFVAKAKEVLQARKYKDEFLIGNDSILETKKWEFDAVKLDTELKRLHAMGFYGVVFGHQPEAFNVKGRSAVKVGGQVIKIDNGMAPDAGSNPGSLLVFPKPEQMKSMSFPEVHVIFPDGTETSLQPET